MRIVAAEVVDRRVKRVEAFIFDFQHGDVLVRWCNSWGVLLVVS